MKPSSYARPWYSATVSKPIDSCGGIAIYESMQKRAFAIAEGVGSPNVDRDNMRLTDVVMCRVGVAKGHGQWVNEQFIADLVELGKAKGDTGVKVRYGHPPCFEDPIGTEIGYATNWRLSEDGQQAIADVDFVVTDANRKDINHIMGWADVRPSMLGNSIEFGYKPMRDEDGQPVLYEGMEQPVISSLDATAIVSDPAATEALFHTAQFSEQVNRFMSFDTNLLRLKRHFANNPEQAELIRALLGEPKQTFKHPEEPAPAAKATGWNLGAWAKPKPKTK